MKNLKRNMMAVICAVLLMALCLFTGCASDTSSVPASLVLVGGGHSCMPVFSSNTKTLYDNLYDCAYSHGSVTMLNCDGSPQVFFQAEIPEPRVSGLSQNKQRQIAEGFVMQLQEAYAEAGAEIPEVNTLKAITMAARALTDASGIKILLIVDSGLQTTGYLNFTKGLLAASPEVIVDALNKMDALPDLSNVRIVWIGCGDTIAPQEELSERQKHNLKAIWENILYASGAEYVTFDNGYSTNIAYEDVPNVSTVPVDNMSIDVLIREQEEAPVIELPEKTETRPEVEIVEPEPEPEPETIETIILDSTRLEFQGDLAEFVDEEAASNVLSSVAQELMTHPDNQVFIIGTTAGITDDFSKCLSEARANTVKERLVQLGVSEERMHSFGLGADDPYHEYDLDEAGYMIEEIARRNRKTIIMDVNSSEAMLFALYDT